MSSDYPEFSLLELLEVVTRHRRVFLAILLLAPLLAWLGSFLIPAQYEAVSSLLPPQTSQVQGYSSVLERGVIRGGLRIRNSAIRNSLNLERSLSRGLRYELVDRLQLVPFFGLADVAATDPERARELAAKRLQRATHLELSLKVRVLIIHVVTSDPEMSARIANGYIELLDERNLASIRAAAAERVAYLDRQIDKLSATRAAGGVELAEYEQGSGISDLESQTDSALGILEQLRAHLLDLEIRRERLLEDVAPDSPELQALAAEIALYRDTAKRFTTEQRNAERDGGEYQLYLDFPLADVARHSLVVARLTRELELIDSLIGALVAERERSRMEQFLDVSTTSILDRAVPPADPIWPRRKLIVLVTTLITLVLAYLLLLSRAALAKIAGGHDRAALRRFLAES